MFSRIDIYCFLHKIHRHYSCSVYNHVSTFRLLSVFSKYYYCNFCLILWFLGNVITLIPLVFLMFGLLVCMLASLILATPSLNCYWSLACKWLSHVDYYIAEHNAFFITLFYAEASRLCLNKNCLGLQVSLTVNSLWCKSLLAFCYLIYGAQYNMDHKNVAAL